jgi:hypothetical protein
MWQVCQQCIETRVDVIWPTLDEQGDRRAVVVTPEVMVRDRPDVREHVVRRLRREVIAVGNVAHDPTGVRDFIPKRIGGGEIPIEPSGGAAFREVTNVCRRCA